MTSLTDLGMGSGFRGDLRYAINSANANGAGANKIKFQRGLTGTITLTQGPLAISKDLTIDGPEESLLTVSGNRRGGVFDITADPRVQTVTLAGLTLTGGTGVTVNGSQEGGALYNDHATVTLSACTVSGNTLGTSGSGGGIYNNAGTLILNSSTVSGNAVGASGNGGGIYNSQGTLILNSSTVSGNTASLGGGGIYSSGSALLDPVTVSGSTIANNHTGNSGDGGGLYLSGPATITDSTIAQNTAGDGGGGVFFIAPTGSNSTISGSTIVGNSAVSGGGLENLNGGVTLSDSTVSGNTANSQAGGVFNAVIVCRMTITDSLIADNTGNGIVNDGQMTLSGSTIAGNSSRIPGAGLQAGLGDTSVVNCTISGNTSAGAGGGISVSTYASLELMSVTITANTANGVGAASHGGGGLDVQPNVFGAGRALLRNTLVAGNATASLGPDVFGEVLSLGYNLVGQTDDSQGWRATDRSGDSFAPLDPMLGPLQDNGGPTPTHALLTGSPAIGMGDPALYGSLDQRGTARLGGNGFNPPTDIGAFSPQLSRSFRLLAPSQATAGEPFTITAIALDDFGHTASTYTRKVQFSSTDPAAVLPRDYTFAPGDGGMASFTITLQTAGSQQLQVDDAGQPTHQGTATVTVNSPAAGSGARLVSWTADSADLSWLFPGRKRSREAWWW